MSIAVVTGAGGLIGSTAAEFFIEKGMDVVGIDNNMREYFFGPEASTAWRIAELEKANGRYRHYTIDIRNFEELDGLFTRIGGDVAAIVHAAAQPSHDWAAKDPRIDFAVNASGTLNLLEVVRRHTPASPFVFLSTNKVYGDRPNSLPFEEMSTRWEIHASHTFHDRG